MIGVAAVMLSLFAGSYFRQAALDAQMNSLSRVIEVASEEVLKNIREDTFHLATHLSQNRKLIDAIQHLDDTDDRHLVAELLDDSFINGFPGFTRLDLEKIRVYDKNLVFLFESTKGIKDLKAQLDSDLKKQLSRRHGIERLQAIDALWLSEAGPLYSTVVPIGGLNIQGFLEIIINPSLNLPDIGNITKTPINIYSVAGTPISIEDSENLDNHLPVSFTMTTSDGKPAFRIIGYEDVSQLIQEMENTRIITVSGFLLLTLAVLLFALWLFHYFLFIPIEQMIRGMKSMAEGNLNNNVFCKGLREFYILAQTFKSMAEQIKARTNELKTSQNRLLRLLDLHETAIMYFSEDNDIVYANKGACDLFGYSGEEMRNLYLPDIFSDNIDKLIKDSTAANSSFNKEFHIKLHCIRKNSETLICDAIIHILYAGGESGYAIALTPAVDKNDALSVDNATDAFSIADQRMSAVEQSLNSLLEIAHNNPGLLGDDDTDISNLLSPREKGDNGALRNCAVDTMQAALSCWEHDLGKTKMELAEDSRIWQVYIDKSTPTTRTLDKYLHADKCPKNPRCQRVIDTAEFVLKQLGNRSTTHQKQLESALQSLRRQISGQNA